MISAVWPTGASVLVLLPWICPWSDWPAPAVLPLLVNVACLALLSGGIALSGLPRQTLWRAACWGWLFAALANTVLALLQFFDLVSSFQSWVAQNPPGQFYGNVRQRNQYATLCAMGLAVLLWRGRSSGEIGSTAVPARSAMLASVLAAALLGVGLALSKSRTGLMELVLLWLLLVGWKGRALTTARAGSVEVRMMLVAALAYALSSWLMPLWTGNQETSLTRLLATDDSCASRRLLWGNMWQLVMQKPWLGWGWDPINYAHFVTEYQGPRFCGILDNAHNLPLHLAVTLGLPVALLIVAVVALVIYRAKPWHAVESDQRLAWAVLALIGMHSMVEYPLWTAQFQLAVLLCSWYLYGGRRPGPAAHAWLANPVWSTPLARAVALTWAAALLLACALVYRSYDRVRQLYVPPQLRPPEYAKGIGLQARDIALFVHEIGIAQLNAAVTPNNAQNMLDLAFDSLRNRVTPLALERAIAALKLLGRVDEARLYEARYQAILPQDYAHWRSSGRQ